MRATELGRELIYPLTDRAIVYAVLFYWFLFGLAYFARFLGIPLLFLTLPAYFRFLLYLLEARANGRPAPVPAIEMFNPADNLWTLTPLIHLAVGIWAGILLESSNSIAGQIIAGMAILIAFPASMAVLAITHSPISSLNPVTIANMMRVCGSAYGLIPTVLIVLSTVLFLLYLSGVPLLLVNLGASYAIVLLFSLTGGVLRMKNVTVQVEIEGPLEPDAAELAQDLSRERRKVANHAYGFISRGNRQGGFEHIRQWLDKETAPDEAWQWFFEEMLKWENKEPALFFAQEYLHQLLEWHWENEAIKLIARCLHENERWRPLDTNRDQVNELLQRHRRNDLSVHFTNS